MSDIATLIAIAVMAFIYVTPMIIASNRKHMNTGSIIVVNLFLGWSVIGWIAALAWSLSSHTKRRS